MNEIIAANPTQLPDTLEDLTQFVLVGKAKLQAYMLKLQTVNKLSVAQEIRDQTLKETQEVSNALIAAEQRIGELLLAIPKQSGGDHGNQFTGGKNPDSVNFAKTKSETIKEMGYGKNEAFDYQQMAKHPEVVQRVIDDALANGEVVTKSQVLKEIKAEREKLKAEMQDLKEERDYLESKLEEAQEYQQKEKEILVQEVPPKDYQEIKDSLKMYKTQAKSAEAARIDVVKQLEEAKKRIKDLEERKDLTEMQKKLEEEAGYFAVRTYDYIQKNGGFVWITERLEQLPDDKRKEFVNTVYAIDAFAKQMVENIGGYTVE